MSISQITAFVLNNIMILAGGGLISAWLAWRMWKKIDATMAKLNGWGDLTFWAGRLIVVIAVLIGAGWFVFNTVNSAVTTAVSSPSVQVAGEALVAVGAGIDAAMTGNVGANISSNLASGLQMTQFQPVQFSGFGGNGGGSLLGGAPAVAEQQAAPVAIPTVKPTPISPMIQQTSGGHDRYTVQAGDTMYAIAQKLLGDGRRYPELCGANVQRVGGNCSLLRAGMTIIVPSDIQAYTPPQVQQASVPVAKVAPAPVQRVSVPVARPATGGKTYTIAAGDNMFAIASKNGGIGKLHAICVANISTLGGNCDQITVGTTIVIP